MIEERQKSAIFCAQISDSRSPGHIYLTLIKFCHCNFCATLSNHLESRQSLNTDHEKYHFLNRRILCRYAWFLQSQAVTNIGYVCNNVWECKVQGANTYRWKK